MNWFAPMLSRTPAILVLLATGGDRAKAHPLEFLG